MRCMVLWNHLAMRQKKKSQNMQNRRAVRSVLGAAENLCCGRENTECSTDAAIILDVLLPGRSNKLMQFLHQLSLYIEQSFRDL